MNYYIDFDYTLFDTLAFRKELYKLLEKNGLNKELLKPTPEVAKSKGGKLFNLKTLFIDISEKYNLPKEQILKELKHILDKCEEFLYSDSIEFLQFLKENGNKVYLLTWGDKEFQEEKVVKSNISKYFDKMIFTEELKFTLNLDYKNSIFIDDSLKDLEGFYKNNALKVIRIRRENGKYSDKDLEIKGIYEYTTLAELKKEIEKTYKLS